MNKKWLTMGVCLFLFGSRMVYTQTIFQFKYQPGDKYKITEVADLRRRENGKYVGFTYRQVRGILEVESLQDGQLTISGDFYIFQETKQNTILIDNQIDQIISSSFTLDSDGSYKISARQNYPTSRDFPLFPAQALKPGDKWQAHGYRLVDPLNDGVFTLVDFYCDYTYKGIEEYKGVPSHLFLAQYALRYKAGDDPAGDKRIKEIKYGGHNVTIYFGVQSRKPLFMKDEIIENLGGEHYILTDGKTITLRGFTQTWFDTIPGMQKEELIDELKEKLTEKDEIVVEESPQGIKLSLPDIRFFPESDKILPEEQARLESLYRLLLSIEKRTFLITGHTADVGTTESQYKLSVQRAKAIVDFLVNKGIDPRRFLYEGKGGTLPLAPNDTEANRAQNRRVEITILED